HWHSIHNSFESYWKGVLSHDLLPNRTYHELAAWRKEMLPLEEKLINLKKHCEAAILVDNASLTGLDEFPIGEEEHLSYNQILRRIYDSLYEMNIEADLLSVEDDFTAFKLLIVPALYSASEKTLEKIRKYVENGGHLLLTFKSAFSDEELKIYHDAQPHLLTDVVGATYDQFTKPVDVTVSLDGKNYTVTNWMEMVRPETAEVWAFYAHKYWKDFAAITHKKYGNGSAAYLGCYLEKDGMKALFRRLLPLAEIALPDIEFPVIRKAGKNDAGKQIQYFFNYSSKPHTFHYRGSDTVNLLTGEAVSDGTQIELGDWDLIILEG
ncbi:MAG: beta-galactosidase trimerization domain-containing protein, partial [Lachnospiraceae bacterium]|nr:beta-galactosidase trimerization domain-containing protein [Lachnospiraceae bacterium]